MALAAPSSAISGAPGGLAEDVAAVLATLDPAVLTSFLSTASAHADAAATPEAVAAPVAIAIAVDGDASDMSDDDAYADVLALRSQCLRTKFMRHLVATLQLAPVHHAAAPTAATSAHAVRLVGEHSAMLYVSNLVRLHRGAAFDDLAWLQDTGAVDRYMATISVVTRATYANAIVRCLRAALSMAAADDTATREALTPLLGPYEENLRVCNLARRLCKPAVPAFEAVSWESVMQLHAALGARCAQLQRVAATKRPAFYKWASYVTLSLFTLMPPRTAEDYYHAVVVHDDRDLPLGATGYDPVRRLFYYHRTRGAYGLQTLPVPRALATILDAWLGILAALGAAEKAAPFQRLLCRFDGAPLASAADVSACLSKALGTVHRGGAGAHLRHLWLASHGGASSSSSGDHDAAAPPALQVAMALGMGLTWEDTSALLQPVTDATTPAYASNGTSSAPPNPSACPSHKRRRLNGDCDAAAGGGGGGVGGVGGMGGGVGARDGDVSVADASGDMGGGSAGASGSSATACSAAATASASAGSTPSAASSCAVSVRMSASAASVAASSVE